MPDDLPAAPRGLTRPGQLYRVEWSIARSHDRPNDRRNRVRYFGSEADAARQVESIRKWEQTHGELLAVVKTTARWFTVDPDDLPEVAEIEEAPAWETPEPLQE